MSLLVSARGVSHQMSAQLTCEVIKNLYGCAVTRKFKWLSSRGSVRLPYFKPGKITPVKRIYILLTFFNSLVEM